MRNDCEHCADLVERVAWLESELGLQRHADMIARITSALATGPGWGRPQVAGVLAALYAAKGRVVSKWQIIESLRSPSGNDDRGLKMADVLVCRARAALGKDIIETVWGLGYRITPAGEAKIAELLGRAVPEAAA